MPRGFSMDWLVLRRLAWVKHGGEVRFELRINGLAENINSCDKTKLGRNENNYPDNHFMADIGEGNNEFSPPAKAGEIHKGETKSDSASELEFGHG